MTDAYLQYTDDAHGITARWHGGEYVDIGYIADADSHIRNSAGIPSHNAGDFVATDVINVWDHAKNEARIGFNRDEFIECVESHLFGEEDEDDDEY